MTDILSNLMDVLSLDGKVRSMRKRVESRMLSTFDAPQLGDCTTPEEKARVIAQHARSPFTANDEVGLWSRNLDTVYRSSLLGKVSLLGLHHTHRVPGPWNGTVTDGFTALYAITGTKVTTLAYATLEEFQALRWSDAHQTPGRIPGPIQQEAFVSLFQQGGIITVEMGMRKFDRRRYDGRPVEERTLLALSYNENTLERAAPAVVVTA